MLYGVSLPPFADARRLVELGVIAEESGWDGVFVWDHLQFIVALELDIHDPWSLLAAMAVRTNRVRLSPCVTPLARRRPQIVAKQLVTLDHLSNGRAMLGVGLGDPADADFADFGDAADAATRAARLDEHLDLVSRLVAGERVDHDGVHTTVHARLLPASIQRPRPPIFVAGFAPHRRPLLRALHWDGFFPLGTHGPLSPQDLASYLSETERPEGWQLFAPLTEDHDIATFEAVGVDWLVLGTWPVGNWLEALTDKIRRGPPHHRDAVGRLLPRTFPAKWRFEIPQGDAPTNSDTRPRTARRWRRCRVALPRGRTAMTAFAALTDLGLRRSNEQDQWHPLPAL